MSHTASKTWVSDEAQERERFQKFKSSRKALAPGSPFVPISWKDWVTHREKVNEDGRKLMQTKIAQREAFGKREDKTKMMPPLDRKVWKNNMGAVVAHETVFTPWYTSSEDRVESPWPCQEEFKHEGGDREKSEYRRQLPLPRKPGNATVNWKQRQLQEPFDFDALADPRSPDARRGVRHEPMMAHFIGAGLLKEISK